MPVFHRRNLLLGGTVGLLALAFALRVFTLTGQSLWRDEVDALRFATAPLSQVIKTFTQPGWNGPLYFLLLRGWIGLTGQSEFALRFSSLLFGVLAVALAFVLARRLTGTAAALVCSMLFALSPYFIWYSQEVKMYTLILAMATLAIYTLKRAVETHHPGWWATLVIATMIAFYSHILAALLIPIEMILALVWGIGSQARRWWIGALVSFASLTLPYLPLMLWQIPLALKPSQTGYTFYPFDRMLMVMLNAFSTGITKLPDVTAWLCGSLMLIGVFLSSTSWRDKAALGVWLLLPPLALYLVSLQRPIFTDRYLIWIGPAFYLFVAWGVVALWRLCKPLGSVAVLATATVLIAGAYSQATQPIKSDFRSAVRHFQAQHSPGDLVIFQIPYVRYTFDYYYHGVYKWEDGLFTNYGMSDAEVDLLMGQLVAGHKTVWLVASEMEMWDGKLQVWKWLEANGRQTEAKIFAQVTLYRYEF